MLLEQPNPDDALDAFKAQLYRTDRSKYFTELKTFVTMYASADVSTLMASCNISGTPK